MRKKAIILSLIGSMIGISAFSGCGAEKDTHNISTGSKEITVTDMANREVTLPETPQKIVSLLASDVEILYALGAEDQIVGIGEYCNYPTKAIEEKTVVSTGAETNLEQILALEPDLVIIGSMAQDVEQAEQIEKQEFLL